MADEMFRPYFGTMKNEWIEDGATSLPGDVENFKNALAVSDSVTDIISEFAGRICFASTDKMLNAKNFLPARQREGHLDIFEHNRIAIPWKSSVNPRTIDRFADIDKDGMASANFRTWMRLVDNTDGENQENIASVLLSISNQIKADPDFVDSGDKINMSPMIGVPMISGEYDNVLLLGATVAKGFSDYCNGSTFYISGISRAASMQLVRHRLLSFSQESQRYVDFSLEGNGFVYPNEDLIDDAGPLLGEIAEYYSSLRGIGVLKEDARMILPNAIKTRLIVSGSNEGLRHFVWLRALDKAAQKEIRSVAQSILLSMHQIDSSAWEKEMDVLMSKFGHEVEEKVKCLTM